MVSYVGKAAIDGAKNSKEILFFIGKTVLLAFTPSSWDRSTRTVLIKQIYFTSVQILPFFLAISIFFGASVVGVVIGALESLNLTNVLGKSALSFMVTELAPLTTVALLSLRSSSATNTEIAVMRVNSELDTLEAYGIDTNRYLIMPRMVSMVLSCGALSTIFIIISATLGSVVGVAIFGMSYELYFAKIVQFASIDLVIFLYLKTLLFGIIISVIPIHSGINAKKMLSFIPVSVLNGMVGIFKAILLVEVVLFLVKMI